MFWWTYLFCWSISQFQLWFISKIIERISLLRSMTFFEISIANSLLDFVALCITSVNCANFHLGPKKFHGGWVCGVWLGGWIVLLMSVSVPFLTFRHMDIVDIADTELDKNITSANIDKYSLEFQHWERSDFFNPPPSLT